MRHKPRFQNFLSASPFDGPSHFGDLTTLRLQLNFVEWLSCVIRMALIAYGHRGLMPDDCIAAVSRKNDLFPSCCWCCACVSDCVHCLHLLNTRACSARLRAPCVQHTRTRIRTRTRTDPEQDETWLHQALAIDLSVPYT